MTTPRLPREDRDDLTAALAARRELGPDYDDAFVESLVDRIEATLAARQEAAPKRRGRRDRETGGDVHVKVKNQRDPHLTLAVVSLVFAVPLSGIGAGTGQMAGLLAVWAGIIIVNIVYGIFR